jgi:protein O-mannosyl-transferase
MAKPMLVTLPFVLLLLDYWPLGRAAGLAPVPAGSSVSPPTPGLLKKGGWQLIWEKIPLFILAAASCRITLLAQEVSGSVMPLFIRSLDPRIASTLVAYIKYLVKMFWPFPMIFFYPLRPLPWWEAAWAGV